MTLSLAQANAACKFQELMDDRHAAIFARALPHVDTDLDTEAIRAFERYAHEHQLLDALAFLHEAISPSHLAIALSGANSPFEARLCGI